MSKNDKDKELDKAKVVNASLLSDAEKENIEKEVQQQLEDEAKAEAEEKYRDKLIKDAKRKALMKDAKPGDPNADGLVAVFIDLPPVSECIRLDGTAYYPGRTYNVKPDVREVILECMARGQEHEDSINGKTAKENLYKKKNKQVIRTN
jgi:hypothetical protein